MQEALRPEIIDGIQTEGTDPPKYSLHSHQPYVIYQIHLHPTYNVPTLWFTMYDLPMGEPAFDLDSVYRYLVPDEFKGRLRAAGIMGGLSGAVRGYPCCDRYHLILLIVLNSRTHSQMSPPSLFIPVRLKRAWKTLTVQ